MTSFLRGEERAGKGVVARLDSEEGEEDKLCAKGAIMRSCAIL